MYDYTRRAYTRMVKRNTFIGVDYIYVVSQVISLIFPLFSTFKTAPFSVLMFKTLSVSVQDCCSV